MALFITGTDTGVGKTVVTTLLASRLVQAGRSVCVYKPVQTGSSPTAPEDPFQIRAWLGLPTFPVACSYCLEIPAAPWVSDTEGVIRWEKLLADYQALRRQYDVVLVEGAGGIRVPVTADRDMRDLMRAFQAPVLVVARANLGTINHTLMTVEALLARQLEVSGVLVSNYPTDSPDPAIQTLPRIFDAWLPVPLLGCLPELSLEPGSLSAPPPALYAILDAALADVTN